MNRRAFTGGMLAYSSVTGLCGSPVANALAASSGPLPPWTPGSLDIHHIDTGRGNATLLLCPDGTAILIDCGTTSGSVDVTAPPRPDGSRQPGEWVARYALRAMQPAGRTSLDYMVATHIHPDHVGDLPPGAVADGGKGYVATGLSQVDDLLPAAKVIDRAYPEYGATPPLDAPFAKNYLAWLRARVESGRAVEPLTVGSVEQIRLRTPLAKVPFSIRGVAANGNVWTGRGAGLRSLFPLRAAVGETPPPENACSIALKLTFGRFTYYTGGDLNAETEDGRSPWMDVERPVVDAVGRVEVAVADHHGYYDACGPEFVKALDAQVYVIPGWHVTHPGQAQLQRLVGGWPGARHADVFATEMLTANRQMNARFVGQMRGTQGHVVVRVAPGGEEYRVFAIDSTRENGAVTGSFGPYRCRT